MEDLMKMILEKNCSCHNIHFSHEQKQDNTDATACNGTDMMSEIISFCLLSGGLILLFKLFYSEYTAYANMTSEGKDLDNDINRISVSIGEFLQYRYHGITNVSCHASFIRDLSRFLQKFRVDFYFSSNPLAKPMVLLSITFVIIVVSCFIRMALQVTELDTFYHHDIYL
jgi:hypothetical protein